MTNQHVYSGITILLGVIIGAGILALPHAIAQAGYLTGLIGLIVIGTAMLVLNLCLGEVTLRTKQNHQLTGYAEQYLGKIGKHLMGASMIIGIYGALIAYMIGGGESLAQIFGGTAWNWSALFFIIGIAIIHKGMNTLEESAKTVETTKIIIFLIITIMILFSGKINTNNLQEFNIWKLLTPYGIILFAYLGTTAIPEMHEAMKGHLKHFKKAIMIGSIIPIIVYTIFTLIVIGASGNTTAEIATITIGQTTGKIGIILANLFATLAMFTAFTTLGYGLKEMYNYDYKLTPTKSWILTAIIPIILLLAGIQSFTKTLEITGAISGGLAGVLTVIMHIRAKKHGQRKPEYTINPTIIGSTLLIAMFIIGAIYTIKELI